MMENNGIILVVDDSRKTLKLITSILEAENYMVLQAAGGKAALKVAQKALPDLILLDINMPGISGYEVCQKLKINVATKYIPVVFLSGLTDQKKKLKAFQSGGVDYIEKPVQSAELLVRVKTHIQLHRIQTSLETAVKERTITLEKTNASLEAEIKFHRETEKKLRVSKTKYQLLYDNTPVMMHSIDKDGRLINVNRYWLEKLGYEREEVIGKKSIEFLTEQSARFAVNKILPEFFKKGVVENIDYQMKKKNGEIICVLLSAVLEKDETGNEFSLALIVDITQKKRAEREMRSLEARLIQAQKMEAIGTLAGGIAHDFNNILSSIFGYAELARMVARDGGDVTKELDEVMNAGYRARELIKHILLFSRKADILKRPLPLIPLLKETIKFIRATLPPTISIKQQISVTQSTIMADSTQMYQVIMNLCTNAAHAMNKKGGLLKINLDEVGKHYQMTIEDTGQGILKEHKDKIFNPFFTTKERGEGTGLGLSIVHGIIKDMDGTIQMFSEPGKGTRVEVLLPKVDVDTTEYNTDPLPIEKGYGRILFVDDEPQILQSNSKIMEHYGYEVVPADNPVTALELFKSHSDFFDLVITDYFMPNMTGLELAKKINEMSREIPIILCTGFSILLTKETLEENGICEIIMKPVIVKELLDALSRNLIHQPNEKKQWHKY